MHLVLIPPNFSDLNQVRIRYLGDNYWPHLRQAMLKVDYFNSRVSTLGPVVFNSRVSALNSVVENTSIDIPVDKAESHAWGIIQEDIRNAFGSGG